MKGGKLINSNKFLGFFIGFLLMGSGLGTNGKMGKALIVAGAAIAVTLFLFPCLKTQWKTVNMLRIKYGLKTYREAEKELKNQ